MFARSPSLIVLVLVGSLAGCGAATKSATKFHGEEAKVASAIDALSNAAAGHDAAKICNTIFAPAVSAKLKGAGGTCPSVVGKQLDTVDTFNVTVQRVTITGASAQARVTSTSNGKDHTDTFSLLRLPDGSWRVASLL